MSLESKLEKVEKKLLISQKQRELLNQYANQLKSHHKPTSEHSDRVALKAVEIAEVMGMGINASRALYYGARLHDIGKIGIPTSMLQKKGFSEDDMDRIKSHSQMGYLMLKDDLPFTAMISLLHHSYKKEGYPKIKRLDSKINLGKVHRYARIISLVDCYDAIIHRPNGSEKRLNKTERIQKMHDTYREDIMSKMINLYYSVGIFK